MPFVEISSAQRSDKDLLSPFSEISSKEYDHSGSISVLSNLLHNLPPYHVYFLPEKS
ncbi:hypothetical protein PIB30_067087, partial [Stylosanthes scabra]|nr:hypothetical protein [Stylosanthes scabra]